MENFTIDVEVWCKTRPEKTSAGNDAGQRDVIGAQQPDAARIVSSLCRGTSACCYVPESGQGSSVPRANRPEALFGQQSSWAQLALGEPTGPIGSSSFGFGGRPTRRRRDTFGYPQVPSCGICSLHCDADEWNARSLYVFKCKREPGAQARGSPLSSRVANLTRLLRTERHIVNTCGRFIKSTPPGRNITTVWKYHVQPFGRPWPRQLLRVLAASKCIALDFEKPQ
ncbi:hypothetical protein JKP88DRAFT_242969 [Tribonema minus]|uniref:Uncharacterized protein n=1 Tax=Tribonema minus TaxID=303371 RepID=A0A835ZC96_9STRA|nr:hypothetical protein JKP88DRAFT_242969 [Tribonema minus]